MARFKGLQEERFFTVRTDEGERQAGSMSKKEDISPPDFAVATKAEAEETEPLVPVAVASPAKVPPAMQREITTPRFTTWGS